MRPIKRGRKHQLQADMHASPAGFWSPPTGRRWASSSSLTVSISHFRVCCGTAAVSESAVVPPPYLCSPPSVSESGCSARTAGSAARRIEEGCFNGRSGLKNSGRLGPDLGPDPGQTTYPVQTQARAGLAGEGERRRRDR